MGTASSLKQELHALADRLPDSATWDDVIEQARLRKAVEEGLAARTPYLLVHRIKDDVVEIVRPRHGRQDWQNAR